jgi:hypothetical protein
MTIQRVPVTGGCLCGAVRYESKEPPIGGVIAIAGFARETAAAFSTHP